ncbi:Internal virion protein C [Ralstonia mannitolilytica]|uniref:hypothetical protein n=2 Tax=Ralstonia mannitolilytica TaxID=105219 RepID=UPI000AE694C7|nr:hypothetical protein [Ralstonia mannitolilytica]CAJ0783508.1 hypothetical protein R77555_01084 [Ralstonia mannitolilytica]
MAGSMGPNSFALNPDGSVVVQNPVNNTSGVQTTLTGGPSSATPNAPGARIAPTDWNGVMSSSFQTLDAINKLAGNVLKPYVEAEEKKAYFEGAARVAQGQSLQQIENDQPWFTKIFGPSATVRGAQAMAATTALTQAESQTLEDMQDLKQKSPDEFRSYLVSQAASIKATGDPLVDATVQAKLAEQWGPLMKTHMREHIAWQQADMLEKQVNLNVSQAAALASKRKANSTGWSDEDRAMAYRDAVIAAQPAAGQPKQSWSKGMVRSLKGALNGGYFDYYNAIKASPLWNEIDADAREALEAAVPQYVMKDARNNPAITNITNDLGALEFNLTHGASGITRPEELHSVIDEYNARHRKETGSEEPLINNTKRAQMLKEWMTGQLHAQTQGLALAKKEDNFRLSGDLARTAFMTGNASSIKGLELDSKAVNDAMNAEFDAAVGSNDPAAIQRYFDRAAQVSHDEKLRSSKLQELMRVQIPALTSGNGPLTEQQITALNYAKGLYKTLNGPQAVADYVGADNAGKVIQLINSGVDTNDVQALNAQRQVIAHTQYKQASTADRTAMQDVINKADPGTLRAIMPFIGGKGALTGWELTPEVKKNLADEYASEAAQFARSYNLPMEQAAQIVLNKRLANADLVPGAIIQANNTVQGDVSLNSAVARVLRSKAAASQSTTVYQAALREMIRDKMTTIVKAKSDPAKIAETESRGGIVVDFDPYDWEVRSGAQLGDGQLALFVWPKDDDLKVRWGAPTMIRIGAGSDENDKDGLAWYINKHTARESEVARPALIKSLRDQFGLQFQ